MGTEKNNRDYMIEALYSVLNLVGGIADANYIKTMKFNVDDMGTEIIVEFQERPIKEEL